VHPPKKSARGSAERALLQVSAANSAAEDAITQLRAEDEEGFLELVESSQRSEQSFVIAREIAELSELPPEKDTPVSFSFERSRSVLIETPLMRWARSLRKART